MQIASTHICYLPMKQEFNFLFSRYTSTPECINVKYQQSKIILNLINILYTLRKIYILILNSFAKISSILEST